MLASRGLHARPMRALVLVVMLSSCELASASLSDPTVSEEADLRSLTPAEILGDLAVGSSQTVLHPGTPLYRAYRFVTAPHTTIDAWARSTTGDAQLWVLGASFQTLGHNDNDPAGGTDAHLRLQLSTGGTYYLAFRESSRHSATFTVSLAGDAIDAGTVGHAIDWCGNGIDEDGDGSDRTCVTDHVLPDLVRTLVLTESNGSAAITGEMVREAHSYNQAAGQVGYPRNVISKVRIENRSVLPAHIEPTLPLTDFGYADIDRAKGQTYDSVTSRSMKARRIG